MAWSPITNGEDGLSIREKLNALGEKITSSAPRRGSHLVLFEGENIALDTTDDQELTKVEDFTKCLIREIIIYDGNEAATGSLGSVYTAPAKGGIALNGATQSWAGLQNPGRAVTFPVAINAAGALSFDSVYVSLSTASSVAGATCKIIITGYILE